MQRLGVWSLCWYCRHGFQVHSEGLCPRMDKQYFTLDMWLPEGTRIEETDKMVMDMAEYIRGQEETEMVSTYVGRTPPRYYLSNVSFGPQSNLMTQILVKCKTSNFPVSCMPVCRTLFR